jgi:xylan 1,4-beta-xylosidase
MTTDVHATVDFARATRSFTPLHGINNGPICFGGVLDLSEWHRKLNLPATRLHDCGWPHPVVVDIPTIYPDFWADPDDPASYRFERTDDYLASLVPLTGNVIYRLGTSIEHTTIKYDTAPPPDFTQWARICVGLIRHLNDGWADGHHFGIRDFEIWNEPDIGERMWKGTQQQYFELYAHATRAIKRYDSSLRVGGPVVANPKGDLGPNFLDYVAEHQLPLDFFAWHRYASDPADLATHASDIRSLLDERGFGAVDSCLTEWNWVTEWHWAGPAARDMHLRNRSSRGAAFVASSLVLLQDTGLAHANYYSGDTQWFGLFDEFGIPQKNYFGLLACRHLFDCQRRVAAAVSASASHNLVVAAGTTTDGDASTILLSNFEGDSTRVTLETNVPIGGAVTYDVMLLDDDHDLETVRTVSVTGRTWRLVHTMPPGTVMLLRARTAAG